MDAGELFVKIRPDTSNFTREAEGPVGEAGKKLSKIFLAAFAIGGIAETIKSVVEAATKQQEAFAVLEKVLKNAGLATRGFSADLKDKLEVQARATGVSAEDLAFAMSRLVPATRDSEKSLKDLNTAIGISETYHISLSTAALALAKAETGSFNSLQRYLGAIPRLTTSQDELKRKYDAVIAAHGKLDPAQKAAYEDALKAAKAADAQATAQNSLTLATEKFGGVAQTFAGTYEGQFARLHVAAEQLKVAIGTELVAGLSIAAGSTADFIDKLIASDKVQEEGRQIAHDLGSALHTIGAGFELIGPPLVSVTDSLGGFVRVAEVAAALFVGNKILGGLAGIGAAEEVLATGGAAAAGSMVALTAALEANTAALLENAGAEATAAAGAVELGAAATVTAGKVGIFAGSVGLLKKALVEYLIVNQAIKQLQPDLGFDFSNAVASDVKGANGSPYPKGSPLDDLYQAGHSGERGATLHLGAGITAAVKNLTGEQRKAYEEGFKSVGKTAPGNDFLSGAIIAATQDAVRNTKPKIHDAGKDAGAEVIKGLREGIKTDQAELAQLKIDMADAVRQGAQAINSAVDQAKGNLNSVGQSLAGSIAAFIDKPLNDAAQRLGDAQDRIAAVYDRKSAGLNSKIAAVQAQQAQISAIGNRLTLSNLAREVALPGGQRLSADPATALAELGKLQASITRRTGEADPALAAYILQYRSAALTVSADQLNLKKSALDARHTAETTALQLKGDALKLTTDLAAHQKTAIAQRLADLTDEFNKHPSAQALATLERRTVNVLMAHGVTRAKAVKELGVGLADVLSGQEQGVFSQGAATIAGPQRPGSGLVPTIVRPLETLAQTQKQIAGIASQERAKQLDESKKQTKLLEKLAGAKAARDLISSLDKNPGEASAKQGALAGVGG